METNESGLTIDELVERFELRPRTIHFYIMQGLLRSPRRGRGARYGEEHQLRLEVIRQLTDRHVPLAEIKKRLPLNLPLEELRRLVEDVRRQAEDLERTRSEPSPRGYIAALLEQARSTP